MSETAARFVNPAKRNSIAWHPDGGASDSSWPDLGYEFKRYCVARYHRIIRRMIALIAQVGDQLEGLYLPINFEAALASTNMQFEHGLWYRGKPQVVVVSKFPLPAHLADLLRRIALYRQIREAFLEILNGDLCNRQAMLQSSRPMKSVALHAIRNFIDITLLQAFRRFGSGGDHIPIFFVS